MSSLSPTVNPAAQRRAARERLNRTDRFAGRALSWISLLAGVLILAILIGVTYEVIDSAAPAISHWGLGFITSSTWDPTHGKIGAGALIYGSLVTSVGALFLGGILGISIGLFLALMAPPPVAAIVGPLVELLAAIPSIVFGLIGLVVICPWLQSTITPALHSVLGWIPLFGAVQTSGYSIFAAILVLTVMVVPIISALTRDVFRTVPQELKDGAEALGATRWEMIRGVVLPTTRSGIAAACTLGFARAIGEAIAVSLVIGGTPEITGNLFKIGSTLASNLAANITTAPSQLILSGYFYSALILLVIGIGTSVLARRVGRNEARG
jgi:phosphate transport system permease protein